MNRFLLITRFHFIFLGAGIRIFVQNRCVTHLYLYIFNHLFSPLQGLECKSCKTKNQRGKVRITTSQIWAGYIACGKRTGLIIFINIYNQLCLKLLVTFVSAMRKQTR